MPNVSVKWPALVLVFLATLAAAYTLGQCTGAKAPAESTAPISPDNPLLFMPTTVDTVYVPLPQDTIRVEVPVYFN